MRPSSTFFNVGLNFGQIGFQKKLKPASLGADFLYDENIDHTEKKSSK